VFGYPAEAACEVALQSVMEWLESNKETNRIEHIIFNVFTKRDLEIYQSFGEKMLRVEIKEEHGKEEEENEACSTLFELGTKVVEESASGTILDT
jgi:hypothetical protein